MNMPHARSNRFDKRGIGGVTMRRGFPLFLGVFVLLLWGPSWGETFETFRGIKWGTDKKVLSDLIAGPQRENVEVYTRKEAKKVGDIEVENIYYMFYRDKFGAAMITFQGTSISARLKEALRQKYGPAIKPDSSAEKYIWDLAELKILFNFLQTKESGSIEYFFKSIVQQREEEKTKVKRDTEQKMIDDL
jgi:hypothetical protein